MTPQTNKPKILLPYNASRNDVPNFPEFTQFQDEFTVIIQKYDSLTQLQTDLKSKYTDISVYWETSTSFKLGGFNKLIPYFPESLKLVVFPWVGANGFDHGALRKKGIDLVNVGNASSYDVADIALSLTLSAFRYTSYFETKFKESGDILKVRKNINQPEESDKMINWGESLRINGNQVESPRGKVAGIIGFGSIGKEIAKRLNVIGMEIYYNKRTPLSTDEIKELGITVEYLEFDELIKKVDLIVLVVPETPDTINLINESTLKVVKKGVRIVNVGRGSAIDENALFKALDDGIVNSVGLDVFLNEPLIDKRFLNRSNVTILPHLGVFTVDDFRNCYIKIMESIRKVLKGEYDDVNVIN